MSSIALSMASADFSRLGEAVRLAERAGCAMLHLEVMDGHFVSEIALGQPVVESLRKATSLKISVELLAERPERFVEDMARAGADCIAVHSEATPNLHYAIQRTRATGRKVGVALNPGTPIEAVAELMPEFDYLLIVAANTGPKEPQLIRDMVSKIARAAEERRRRGLHLEIYAAGGIGPSVVDLLTRAGADILVANSAIFNKHGGESALEEMVQRARQARGIASDEATLRQASTKSVVER